MAPNHRTKLALCTNSHSWRALRPTNSRATPVPSTATVSTTTKGPSTRMSIGGGPSRRYASEPR